MYYVRMRGKIIVPFPLEHVKDLVERGQVAAFREVSSDGATWMPAGSVADLFPTRQVAVPVQPYTSDDDFPEPRSGRHRDRDEDEEEGRRDEGFRCPFCRARARPIVKRQISTAGWVLFVVLLICCFPLCALALLVTEEYRV